VYANYNTGTSSRGGWAEIEQWDADIWQWTSSADVPGFSDDTIDMNHVRVWETLSRITNTITPPEEADMKIQYVWRLDGQPGAFWVCDGSVVHLDATMRDDLLAKGVREVVSNNTDVRESYRRVAEGIMPVGESVPGLGGVLEGTFTGVIT
jgi:hypothetical protein